MGETLGSRLVRVRPMKATAAHNRSTSVAWAIVGLLTACAHTLAPEPRHADIERIKSQFPDTTLAELETGRRIYLSRCTSCHAPVAPRAVPAQRWPEEVREMSERARLGKDERAVVKYLVAQALRDQL